MRAKRLGLTPFLAAVLLAAPVGAGTVYVSQEGTDQPSCGPKAAPCRSISRAIAHAGSGDAIRVGPGRYGDLDGDGAFVHPGDEAAQLGSGCDCMIHIDKRVTLLSEAGSAATVLDGSGVAPTLVSISADGVVFGRANQGFTLTHAGPNQLRGALEVDAATGVTIAGNVASGNAGFGFGVAGGSHALNDNRARDDYLGFRVVGASVLTRNLAASNEYGMQVEGQGTELRDDVVAANRSGGIVVVSGATDTTLTTSHVLGNGGFGVATGAPLVLRGGSIVGNDAGGANCGVSVAAGGSLDADGVFWGSPAGPGGDPADGVCADPGASANAGAPAKKAAALKLKPLR